MKRFQALATFLLLFVFPPVLVAQQPSAAPAVAARLEARPPALTVRVGQEAPLHVVALDSRGRVLDIPLRVVGPRQALRVGNGAVTGLVAGSYEVVASVPAAGLQPGLEVRVPVTVEWPPVSRVELDVAGRLYRGTTVAHRATARHADGSERARPGIEWSSSDPGVATVDPFGNVRARGTGPVEIRATVEGVTGTLRHEVAEFPAVELELLGPDGTEIRTGDVRTFRATARDARGRAVEDLPVAWSLSYRPDDTILAPSGPGQIDDGRFVADVPGVYTVVATSGPLVRERSLRVVRRNAVQKLQVVGQGRESRVFTTDFWIWEGKDGRDYALTGSKMGDGVSFVWDVTDPANIVKTDSILVDARTTNDLKVSPDGRYGAISREGASNRRNGVVILDLADPAHPRIASVYDEGLTGGVHNMFATDRHLFALSNGDKYVILDVSDIYAPRYVSEYDHPGSRVHDVWVHDGVAYSAEWGTGVVVVDVGNGRWGGSIERPVLVTTVPLPSGQTHAVFPWLQESTGKFYLVVGDEIVSREGLAWEGTGPDHRVQYDPVTGKGGYPRATSGYIQFVDFTDPEHPEMVARYEVSEYGTHNMWVEDDVLYQAYYEGGVRMVDLSGELMGNLYTQGREIAVFKAHDPLGYIPNSPGAWSVIPWKGNIFFSDINSGLWAVKILPRERPIS